MRLRLDWTGPVLKILAVIALIPLFIQLAEIVVAFAADIAVFGLSP